MVLLPKAACSYYGYHIYNRFENFKQVFLKKEGNNSHFRMSKNAVSNETCGKKLHDSNLNHKITLT